MRKKKLYIIIQEANVLNDGTVLLSADLEKQITMRFKTNVTDIIIENKKCIGYNEHNKKYYDSHLNS